ncbi:hypothetical protein JTB14_013521 [Gonioctena quinquepunctata]|nr:hypothetical protein JTB14_013521 [Gonioctena quinquepunctata]
MEIKVLLSKYVLFVILVSSTVSQEILEETGTVKALPETDIKEDPLERTASSSIISNEDTLPVVAEKANKTQKFVNCVTGMGNSVVQLLNDTELIKLLQPDSKVTDREIPSLCVVVLFYSKYCPFSALAAPHFNALPRAFPDIKVVAINAMIYHLLNTQNGPVTHSPVNDYDMFLVISWLFVIICGGYFFTKSEWWKWIIESVQSNWRESEAQAQHEHID